MSNDNCGFVALTKHKTIVTKFIGPDIGTDKYDWIAYYEGEEKIGRSATETGAIFDLIGEKNG